MDAADKKNLALIARLALWVLALTTTIVGLVFTSARQLTVEVDQGGDSYSIEFVDVLPIGIALLSVGLVVLATLLLVEGYGLGQKDAPAPASADLSAPAGDVAEPSLR